MPALPPLIHGKSRMRKRACTEICAGGDQRWSSLPRQLSSDPICPGARTPDCAGTQKDLMEFC